MNKMIILDKINILLENKFNKHNNLYQKFKVIS